MKKKKVTKLLSLAEHNAKIEEIHSSTTLTEEEKKKQDKVLKSARTRALNTQSRSNLKQYGVPFNIDSDMTEVVVKLKEHKQLIEKQLENIDVVITEIQEREKVHQIEELKQKMAILGITSEDLK